MVPTLALLQSIQPPHHVLPASGPAEIGVGWKAGHLEDACVTGTLSASLPCQALAGSPTLGRVAMGWGSLMAFAWSV